MEYLDELPSPMPSFFPQNVSERARVRESLALEDSLHMDLRTITMGFLVSYVLAKKSPKVLEAYEKSGVPDPKRDKEVAWWRAFAKDGVRRIRLGPRSRPLLRPLRRLSSGYGGVHG